MFYCICRGARVDLRRIIYPFRRVTAHASRNSAHDGEGERKRGLVTAVHRVNYTIFTALRVNLRGRFPPPRKVSVVRREQIRVLIKTAPLPVHPRCGRPLVGGYAQTAPLPGHPLRGLAPLGGYAQTAAQGAAESAAEVAHHSGSGSVSPSAFFLRRASSSALRLSFSSLFLSPGSSIDTTYLLNSG